MPYLLLTLAIVFEVVGTTALKASAGFTRVVPTLVVAGGYGLAFYFLSLSLQTLALGLAYALWSGIGIVLAATAGVVLFGERVDIAGAVGLALIIAGIAVLNIWSSLSGH